MVRAGIGSRRAMTAPIAPPLERSRLQWQMQRMVKSTRHGGCSAATA